MTALTVPAVEVNDTNKVSNDKDNENRKSAKLKAQQQVESNDSDSSGKADFSFLKEQTNRLSQQSAKEIHSKLRGEQQSGGALGSNSSDGNFIMMLISIVIHFKRITMTRCRLG